MFGIFFGVVFTMIALDTLRRRSGTPRTAETE